MSKPVSCPACFAAMDRNTSADGRTFVCSACGCLFRIDSRWRWREAPIKALLAVIFVFAIGGRFLHGAKAWLWLVGSALVLAFVEAFFENVFYRPESTSRIERR